MLSGLSHLTRTRTLGRELPAFKPLYSTFLLLAGVRIGGGKPQDKAHRMAIGLRLGAAA